ncbi:hypothetical protein DFR67_103225 [Williamsia limnetica]|uniref:Uncharacterized protein n=1 Tax=Williamsia limnetica TaxID=882452 RepID=A0A318RLW7_WILLI|nr:DUF6350 family protein [Williamsia limnetica]PYE19313.1 hypothetical protein DFR67_103225 [Williamsia limnetica]
MRRSRRAAEAGAADSARALVRLAFGTTAATLLLLAITATIILLAVGDGVGSVPATVASMWLGIHQVPLTIGDVTLGVLPLAPSFVMVGLTARATARATDVDRPQSEVTAVVLSAVGGPLLATILSLAVLMDASTVMTVQSPDALLAFACTFVLQLTGAVIGVGYKWWSTIVVRLGVPTWVLKGVRCGLIAVVALLSVAAMLVAVRLMINWSVAGELFEAGNGWIGALGLAVLSVLYLPNVLIGAAAALIGAPVQVGGALVDLFGSHGGQVPPLPVLAVLPDGGAGSWSALLMVFVAVVSLGVARLCLDLSLLRNIRMVAVAAATASLLVVVLATLAGGDLGILGGVGVNLPVVGVFTFGWIAVVGAVAALAYSALPKTRRARAALVGNLHYDDDIANGQFGNVSDEQFGNVSDEQFEDDAFEDEQGPEVEVLTPAEPEIEYRQTAGALRDAAAEVDSGPAIDGWDADDWVVDLEWDGASEDSTDDSADWSDAGTAPIAPAVDGEELVSTDDFGTRRTR